MQHDCRYHTHVCDGTRSAIGPLRRHVGTEIFLSSFSGMLTKHEVRCMQPVPCVADSYRLSGAHHYNRGR